MTDLPSVVRHCEWCEHPMPGPGPHQVGLAVDTGGEQHPLGDDTEAPRLCQECVQLAMKRWREVCEQKGSTPPSRRTVERLVNAVIAVVPYVTATLPSDPHLQGEWCKVHRGRASSSHRQLEGLLLRAQALKETL